MGWKWEVQQWVLSRDGYEYQQVYGGESLLGAVLAMRKAKRNGAGCVKLMWR